MLKRRESRRALRPLLWLTLLLVVGLIACSVVATHQTRARGLPDGFPAPVVDADVPILGVNVALEQYDEEELVAALARVADAGFVWVRQSFYVGARSPRTYDWAAPDRILDALALYPQLRLVAVLDDNPPDPDRFAAFAGEFAARYGAQVDYYQIWDEPNLSDHWGGGPVNPPAYADLLARAAIAIRTADSDAHILLAGLAPTVETGPQNLSDTRYLDQLYQAGAAPYFDVVCGKPYGFDTGPDDRRADESVLNFSRLLLLREVMVEHGDADKAIWASHWGWNALPGPSAGSGQAWTGAPSSWGQTDETTQAARTVAALERARAEWPWAGALILEHFQPAVPPSTTLRAGLDDPRWGFALVRPDGAPRPVYDAVTAWVSALPDAAPVGGYPPRNPWAAYAGDWRVGPLGADAGRSTGLTTGSDGDRATFRFDGSAVALTVRRGPYRAFLYATVDGEPANALPRDEMGRAYVVLYDSEPSVATVPLATDLSPGPHIVEIVAERGQGQWVLVDWRVGAEQLRDGYGWKMAGLVVTGLALAALLVRDVWRVATLARSVEPWGALGWLDLGLALVAFAAPFYLHPGGMFYRVLSLPELLILLCAIAALLTCKLAHLQTCALANLRTFPLDRAVLLLVLAALAAGAAAVDKMDALFELRAVFLFPVLYYALLRLSRLDERARWRIVDGFVLGAVVVAAIGLAQYALGGNVVLAEGGLPRLRSVYHSPNSAGLYLGRAWPLLVAVAVWYPSPGPSPGKGGGNRRRLLYGLALIPVTLALGLSFSRGALLLGLPAALLVMGWRAGGRYRWAALTLVLVGALTFIPLLRVPRFASLLDLREGSTFFRLKLWRSSLALIREHPWFGVGPGNFLAAYRTRYILPSAWQEFNLEHPHSIYLDHWTRLGLLGLLAGIAVQVAFWHKMRQRPRRDALALGLAGGMAALLAHGLVDNTLFFPDLATSFFLMLALVQL